MLEALERANLFVVPLDDDRQWYRYHHLFADVLRHRLMSGVLADNERATDLIEQHGLRIIVGGQVHTVLNWLSALPDGSIRARPLVCTVHALTLAAPEGCIRRFVDEGPVMAAMLQAADARGIAPDYMSRLLAAFPTQEGGRVQAEGDPAPQHPLSAVPQPLVEPLSPRELEGLRLMATGKSNAEAAQTLVIAISTVKAHTNSIFGKLQVTSRTQAIALARDLQLL